MGPPSVVSLEAKADMHEESMPQTEMDTEKLPIYNESDAGYDGEPIATVVPTEGTIDVLVKNKTDVESE